MCSDSENEIRLITCDESNVNIIDTRSDQPIRSKSLKSPTNHGMCMTMCKVDGNSVLIGCEDGHVLLFDHRTMSIVDSLSCHDQSVMAMDYSANLKRCYTASVDTCIRAWKHNGNTLKCYKQSNVINEGFNFIKIRPDDKLLATCGWDCNVRLFGCKKLKPLAVLKYHKLAIQTLSFSGDNTMFAGGKDGQISAWKVYCSLC